MGSCRTVEGNQLSVHLAREQGWVGTAGEGRRRTLARESFRAPFFRAGCRRC